MVNTGTGWLVFLLTMHIMLFQAQVAGYLPYQQGDNPHQEFAGQFADQNNFTSQVQTNTDSGILESLGPVQLVLDLVNNLVGVLAAPYTTITSTAMPVMLKTLITGIFSIFEIYIGVKLVRGVAL